MHNLQHTSAVEWLLRLPLSNIGAHRQISAGSFYQTCHCLSTRVHPKGGILRFVPLNAW